MALPTKVTDKLTEYKTILINASDNSQKYKNYIILALVVGLAAIFILDMKSCHDVGLSKKEIKDIKTENTRLDKENKDLDKKVKELEKARQDLSISSKQALEESKQHDNQANDSKNTTTKINQDTKNAGITIIHTRPDSNILLFPIDAEDYLNGRQR